MDLKDKGFLQPPSYDNIEDDSSFATVTVTADIDSSVDLNHF